MIVMSMSLIGVVLWLSAAVSNVNAATDLSQVGHIVFFMQENRAFNHYFGTMAGVRGFKDPNVLYNGNYSTFYQNTGKNDTPWLLPFYLGDDTSYDESNQCIIAGSNDWLENHQTWNHGKNNAWVTNNTALSWGYYKRRDIPYHFEIAESWTIGDMYAESVIGPTCPNRATWVSGTINAQGSPVGDFERNGGQFVENWLNQGCETSSDGSHYACYPLKWKTVADTLEEVGVDWFVYQQQGDFGDNPFQWWTQFQGTNESDPMIQKGMSFVGMEGFYEQALNGTLPPVSWVIGPFELSEHPPHRPVDGAWLQHNVIDAVANGPLYNDTVIFVSYDETGGFGDHVLPFISPEGTKGEWIKDPKNPIDYVPTGPGFRVPFYVISPWTRGGRVFTEPSDHNSQILFLEEWLRARYNISVTQDTMNPWRRKYMSNLVNMFDFRNPDYSIPKLSTPPVPRFVNGICQSSSDCRREWESQAEGPPVPYGRQTEEVSLNTEGGFKQLRGRLTEGRYLIIEKAKDPNREHAQRPPTLRSSGVGVDFHSESACMWYGCEEERWVVYQGRGNHPDPFSEEYFMMSAHTHKFIGSDGKPVDRADAASLAINFDPGLGYTIEHNGLYLDFDDEALINPQFQENLAFFNLYSITW